MLRIAITGPESSGKTTLCSALAEYYQVSYIPEYARTYLEQNQGQYQCADLDIIAQAQLESLLSFKGQIAICDTDFSVLELWSKYKYNKVFSAFLEGNRLLGGYQIWQNYPVVSPQVYLGVSYQF